MKLFDHLEIIDMLKSTDGVEMSQESFDILLRWMQINKQVQLTKLGNDILLKFGNGKNTPISDVEISLHILEKNKISFENAILALEEEKDELVLTAKSYLRKGMRDMVR